MKRIKYLSIILGVIIAVFFGFCRKPFLDIPPQGSLSDQTLMNSKGVSNLLIGAYAALDGVIANTGSAWESAPDNWVYGSIAGGDSHKGSFGGDQPAINSIETWSVDGSNGYLNDRWKSLYDGVSRANSVLSIINQVQDISDADKKNIEGQARFLRGHYYFQLKIIYNNVPWIDEETTDYNQPNNADLWSKIEEDFNFAYNNLPATQDDPGKANKWAAGAYLAKTYLFERKFNDAKPVFDDIIANGETSNGLKYDLCELYDDNFRAETKNNKESVFAVQMSANNGTNSVANANQGGMLNFPGGNAPFRRNGGFNQPSIDLVNAFRTDASGLPLIHNYNQDPVKNSLGIASSQPFTPDDGNIDPRLDWTVGRRGIPFLDWGDYPGLDWVLTPSAYGPFGPKKNVYWQASADKYADQSSWAPGTAINVVIIRFAHVLLMAAENEAQLGNLANAEKLVNRVRVRAGNPSGFVYKYQDPSNPTMGFSNVPAAKYVISPYPDGYFDQLGKDEALLAIYFEERLELGMEGHRFFDLSRWGIASDVMNKYFTFEGNLLTSVRGAKFTKDKNEFFPIPTAQIDLSKKDGEFLLKQNPGYN